MKAFRFSVALLAAGACVAFVAVAEGSSLGGGLKPSQATSVVVGTHYFGSTNHDANRGNYEYDFWKLPPLLAADVVTMAWNDSSKGGNIACLQENVDDYSWADNLCNGSGDASTNSSGSTRSFIAVKQSSPTAYLEFWTCCTGYPYDFTVESIQHRVGVSLTRIFRLHTPAVVHATAVLSNGASVPDGLRFTLYARWNQVPATGGRATFGAAVHAGALSFNVSLPPKARGHSVSLIVKRAQDAQYLAAHSASLRVPVS